jgi:hypothetical protein
MGVLERCMAGVGCEAGIVSSAREWITNLLTEMEHIYMYMQHSCT